MKGIYLVTDQQASLGRPLDMVVEQAARAGVSCVQLREKNIDTKTFLEKAKQLKQILAPLKIPLIINDRIDIALAAEADGVHIGQSDMPYKEARHLMGPKSIIGLSVETWEDVEEAKNLDVDYLGVSPVFSTPTKTDTKGPWGIEGLKRIRSCLSHPLVAIGGLTGPMQGVLAAGADAIAVVSAICSAGDPYAAAGELVRIYEEHH